VGVEYVLFYIPILAIAGFVLALTFYKPNNKPFVNMLEAGIKYALGDKLFVWERQRSEKKSKIGMKSNMEEKSEIAAKLSGNKLRDLAWSLDVLDLKKQNDLGR
jgi:hypothetical protein